MSVRNRSGYSKYSRRRSGGSTWLRQFALILTMGALSFVLGFFVLARVIPTGHGPETPNSSAPAVTPGNEHHIAPEQPVSPSEASPITQSEHRPDPISRPDTNASAPKPDLSSAPTTAGSPTNLQGGPSIDPEDGDKTQQPSSLDSTNSAVQTPSDQTAAVPVTHHRRRRHRPTPPPEQDATASSSDQTPQPDDGASTPSPDQTPRRRKAATAVQKPGGIDEPSDHSGTGTTSPDGGN